MKDLSQELGVPNYILRCFVRSDMIVCINTRTEKAKYESEVARYTIQSGIGQAEMYLPFKDRDIPIFMVAGENFPFEGYLEYLTKFLTGEICFSEPIYFKEVIERIPGEWLRTNCWFDMENKVFFLLDKEDYKNLLVVLSDGASKLSEKNRC